MPATFTRPDSKGRLLALGKRPGESRKNTYIQIVLEQGAIVIGGTVMDAEPGAEYQAKPAIEPF